MAPISFLALMLSMAAASEPDPVPGWRFAGSDPEIRGAAAMPGTRKAPTPRGSSENQWLPEASSYEFGLDHAIAHGGKSSASLWCKLDRCEGSASLMQTVRADEHVARRVRLSAWVKADSAGKCGLWMRVNGDRRFAFDNTAYRSRGKTFDWRREEIVLDVKPGATLIKFGLVLSERGQAWIDDVKLEPVEAGVRSTDMAGVPVGDPTWNLTSTQCPLPQASNLDFEHSPSVREGVRSDPLSLGRLDLRDSDRQYRDPYAGLSFRLGSTWTVQDTKDSKADGEREGTVILHDAKNQFSAGVHYRVCIEQCRAGKDELDRSLRAQVDATISQRTNVLFKGKGYRVRAGSCRERELNGNRAMTCVSDYRNGKRAMAEYLTCVRSASRFNSAGSADSKNRVSASTRLARAS